jgi:group I intron endonuclease
MIILSKYKFKKSKKTIKKILHKVGYGIIYILTAPNKNKNKKKYVGQTINSKERFKQYRNNNGSNSHFSRALKKYGWKNFKLEIIIVPEFLLNSIEKSLIKFYDTMDPKKG